MGLIKPASAEPLPTKPYDNIFKKITLYGDWGEGKKGQGAVLRSWLNAHVLPAFSERILVVDTAVALCCAKLHVPDPRSDRDAIIAATALVHGMTVVTRNVDDFKPTGVEILNPWG